MDLSTTYMGLPLRSPLVAGASPLSMQIDTVRQLEDAGASAIVLGSLFEEQIEHDAAEMDHYLHYGADRWAESLSYFPEVDEFRLGAEEYLEHIARCRQAVDVPVIASLNGISAGGWVSYAEKIEQAGASGLELNVYYIPTNAEVSPRTVEDAYVTIFGAVKGALKTKLPVAMKLSPFFSNLAATTARLDEAGAEALVLFNRFYQPDIDPKALEVKVDLKLSTSADNVLPLRWIAILSGRLKASLAASTGVHTGADVAKLIMAGADVTMLVSALLRKGPGHLATVRQELVELMDGHEYASAAEMRGVLNQSNCPEPAAYERGNYVKALTSFGMTATFE
jgi:dihydroorotate dehydrogenase (fumarate)